MREFFVFLNKERGIFAGNGRPGLPKGGWLNHSIEVGAFVGWFALVLLWFGWNCSPTGSVTNQSYIVFCFTAFICSDFIGSVMFRNSSLVRT